MADMIWDELLGDPPPAPTIVDPKDMTRRREIPAETPFHELLVPVFRQGRRVYDPPPLQDVRAHTLAQLDHFHPGIKRFVNPHQYPVGLEVGLFDLKTQLILEARGLVHVSGNPGRGEHL
jgi:nicotinate phosphoribosyltransferase